MIATKLLIIFFMIHLKLPSIGPLLKKEKFGKQILVTEGILRKTPKEFNDKDNEFVSYLCWCHINGAFNPYI